MFPLQATKFVLLTPPALLVDNASLTVAELDTKNWDYAQIVLIIGETDIACTACEITDGDVSGTVAAFTGSDFDGDTEVDGTTAALPSATDDDGFFLWELDLRKRKRYLDATITVGDGTAGGYYTVIAILSRGDAPPTSVSGRGCKGIIRI